MSKLNDLINKLCPNGVPYRKLGEIEKDGLIKLGRGKVISKRDIANNPGTYPIYSASAMNNGKFGEYGDYMFDDIRLTWSIDGGGRFFYRDDEKYSVTNVCGWLKVLDENAFNPKFLFYVLTSQWSKLVFNYTIKAHPSVIRNTYDIPMVPLPVQSEIVRILDSFTELEAELEAELADRIEQYEYYRDYLLDKKNLERMDGKPVETKKLGEVGSFIRGNGIQKKDFVDNGYPCIHYGQVYTYYGLSASKTKSFIGKSLYDKRKKANPGDLVIATTSENDEDVCKCVAWLGDVPAAVSGDAYIYSPIDELKVKYLAYFFQSRSFQSQKKRYITGTKVRRVNGESMAKIEFPVPSLATQERIVDILDRFDTLTTSLTDGIPAEIAMRREQYEYYRSRLLDFPRLPEDSNNDGE